MQYADRPQDRQSHHHSGQYDVSSSDGGPTAALCHNDGRVAAEDDDAADGCRTGHAADAGTGNDGAAGAAYQVTESRGQKPSHNTTKTGERVQ